MSNTIKSGSSANLANVNADGELAIGPTQVLANAGIVAAACLNDDGTITGTRFNQSPESSTDYRLRVGIDTVLFNDTFNALTQNTSMWSYTFATLTAAQPGAGTVNFSTVQGTTSAHGAFMRSFLYFPVVNTAPLAVEFLFGQFTANLVAGEEWRVGLGVPSAANVAPIDGVRFKLTTAGLEGEIVYNSSLASTGALLTLADFALSTMYKMTIVIAEKECQFWRDDILLGTLPVPVANGQPFIQGSLPVFMQKMNTGNVTNTNTMRVSDVSVGLMDVGTFKPWAQQMASIGQHANLGQNGNPQGKTSLWANNTAPTAVALTNTAAAFTGLGGIVAVLPTLVVNTDGKLITFQNPSPTINITGRNLIITGITIRGGVSVVFVGGPVLYAYALAYGHTATTLVTTESASFANATTHAPRIMPLGMETYPVTAAVGTLGGGVGVNFDSPIVIRPGEFFDIIARNIGVVTTTGAITFVIGVNGYWE